MSDHIGDDAELYALGALDADEAAAVEQHIDTCDECAARVAEAQATASSLAGALPAVTPSPELERRVRDSLRASTRPALRLNPGIWGYAVAAVFALSFFGVGLQSLQLHQRLSNEDVALATIVHSHFVHVSMRPLSAAEPVVAKVLYARDGSWVYVLADRPGGTLHAFGYTAHGTSDLGALASNGRTASLLVRPRSPLRSIVLRRDGAQIAVATLKY
jgi:anti-sigma factor RsiW